MVSSYDIVLIALWWLRIRLLFIYRERHQFDSCVGRRNCPLQGGAIEPTVLFGHRHLKDPGYFSKHM